MDIKNSVPMRLLAAEKIKHPYFFKRVEQFIVNGNQEPVDIVTITKVKKNRR